MKRIASIQDISCLGRCSLTVALPVISAMAVECAIVPTAVLSTHTMFPGFISRDLSDQLLPIARHWKSQNVTLDAICTGYLASPRQTEEVCDFFDLLAGPDTLLFVDPAMADGGRLYAGFGPDFPGYMRRVVARAHVTVPNVTEACLLSAGRNPDLSEEQIEQKLKTYLGVEKVLWIPRGIYNDETNEHVDNVCAFIRPGEVVLAWTDNEADPQYALSKASLDALEQLTDAKGRKIIVHKLPVPAVPVCITEDEVAGFDFVEGEDMREAGERLAASYVNFYFSNDSVVVPAFGGENAASDALAAEILAKLCPERKVVQIPARAILTGGGNIHCITQQIPKGVCL